MTLRIGRHVSATRLLGAFRPVLDVNSRRDLPNGNPRVRIITYVILATGLVQAGPANVQPVLPTLVFPGKHKPRGDRGRAAIELDVSSSAISHALKGLEDRLGVRLLNRTSRSVTLTAAGEEFQAAVTGPLDAIGQAFEGLNRYRDNPTGRLRLNVMVEAATLLISPVLPVFMDRYPDLELDITASNRMTADMASLLRR